MLKSFFSGIFMVFATTFIILILTGFGVVEQAADVVTISEEVTPVVTEVLIGESNPTPIPTLEISVDSCTNACTDCKYYPVSKEKALSSNYSPKVEMLNISGGGNLIAEAKVELEKMFLDASSQNVSMRVVSSFRSYQTQASLFESYVQREISRNGGDRVKAENTANIYSAKPGHSEHQLGTTVDISCPGCTPFINDASNRKVYDYLKTNAHKFGFVISYTEQNKHITQYKAEPWHIRYLGTQYSTEYLSIYNQLEGNYSIDRYLIAKCS